MQVRNLLKRTIGLMGLGILAGVMLLVAGCPSQTNGQSGIQGSVYGGRQPISGSSVYAYEMATTSNGTPTQIGSAVSDSSGNFTMTFSPTPANGQIVYVVATGGDAGAGTNSAISLMTVAGAYCSGSNCNFPTSVNIDELSTVVSTAAMRLYMDLAPCSGISGNTQNGSNTCVFLSGDDAVSPRFAQSVAAQVDLTTGQATGFLTSQTSSSPIYLTLEKADSLADILAACVNSSGPTTSACSGLFSATLNNAGDTLTAAYDIGDSPVINAEGTTIFNLLPSSPVYTPVVTTAPANWTIAGNVFSYAVNNNFQGDGNVSAWEVSTHAGVSLLPITTGTAGPCGTMPDPGNCYTAGVSPDALVMTPDGKFVYTANYYGSNISAWAVDPATGELVQVTAGASSCGSSLPSNCFAATAPTWMAVDATGSFLYVTNGGYDTVQVFSIDSSTGALTQISGSPFAAGQSPNMIVLDPNGPFAYVANASGSDVSAYTIDPASGALVPVTTGGAGACGSSNDPLNCFAAGLGSDTLAVDASGGYVYVANQECSGSPCTNPGNISAYTIDSTTGALTDVSGSSCGNGLPSNCFQGGGLPYGLAVDESSAYLYVGTSVCGINCTAAYISAYSIGTGGVLSPVTTGGAGSCGTTPDPANCFTTDISPYSVVAAPHTLLAANTNGVISIYNIASLTGAITPVTIGPTVIADINSQGISIDPTGRYAYVTNGDGVLDEYYVDPLTGGLRENNTLTAVNTVGSNVAIGHSGRFLYSPGGGGGNQVAVYSIDTGDGSLSPIAGSSCGAGNTNANCFPAGPVPETARIDASGQYLYTANTNCTNGNTQGCTTSGSVSVFKIDSTTGAPTAVTAGGAGACGDPTDPMNCFSAGLAPFGLAVDQSTGLLYDTNVNGNDISAYTIDSTTGALTDVAGSSCGSTPATNNCFDTGTGPADVTLTLGGQYAYATNTFSNSLTAFSVDSSTGVLTTIDGTVSCGTGLPSTCFEGGNNPIAGAMTPDGAFYYTANYSGNDVGAYSINSTTGAPTAVTAVPAGSCGISPDPFNCFAAGTQPIAVTVDPTGHFVYVVNNNCSSTSCSNPGYVGMYSLDSSTGVLSPVSITSPFTGGSEPLDVVFGP